MWLKYILKSIKLKFDAISPIVSKEYIINYFPIILLVLISVLVSYTNYTPGTYLTGWDTLHPEFNLELNLKRVLSGVWRQEQGLGTLAIHAHMSELPRILFFLPLSLIFSQDILRYLYFFLMLILGPLGVYFFLHNIVFKERVEIQKKTASFSGGLFYLLNLGVVQHFYVPFEMFAAGYAFLPWLFLYATKYFLTATRKNFIIFSVFTIFASVMAYAATLWYAFLAVFVLYLTGLLLVKNQQEIHLSLKRVATLIFAIILLNSYWLFPQGYLLATSADGVSNSKINQMFSEEAFLRDEKYATLDNAAFFKGFLFDWTEYKNGEFVKLLDEWEAHLDSLLIQWFGWILFGLVLAGVGITIIRKEKYGLVLLPVFLFSLFFLTYSHPPFANLFNLLRENFSLFKEGYRFPWTKFSIILIFCYSFYFSRAILEIVWTLKSKSVSLIVAATVFLLLAAWVFPAFSGHLISPSMRVKIPQEYFDTYQWFSGQPKTGRIALFPIQKFWGWEYHDWGFQGAGFIWFGLEQPILVRDFDRWSPYNENYYWGISYALYSGNRELFENVLEKYQIQWLLIDESIINPSSSKSTYLDEFYAMLLQSNKVQLVEEFGFIKVYKVNLDTPVKDYHFDDKLVYVLDNSDVIEPSYKWNNYDGGYGGGEGKGYVSGIGNRKLKIGNSSYYPFRSLFTGKNQEDLEFMVEEKDDHFVFKSWGVEGEGYLEVSRNWRDDLVWVNPENLGEKLDFDPEVYFDGKTVEVKIPKVGGLFSASIDGAKLGGEQKAIYLPNLSHKLGYLITIGNQNIKGRPFLFWLENLNSRRSDIETYLPGNVKRKTQDTKMDRAYFVQPPMEEDGLGYTLHFDNVSIGDGKVENKLGKIGVYPIPYKFLTGLVIRSEGSDPPSPEGFGEAKGKVLVLSQSFNKGWIAFYWDGLLPKLAGEHVLVNNWANGWVLQDIDIDKGRVKIIFWPQILEYIGFVLGAGCLILMWRRKV